MAFLYATFTNAISTKSTFNGIEADTMILCWWSPVTILYFVADYHALESILFGGSCGSICLWPCHNLSFCWKCTNMCLGAVLLCWVVCFESALYHRSKELIWFSDLRFVGASLGGGDGEQGALGYASGSQLSLQIISNLPSESLCKYFFSFPNITSWEWGMFT